MANKITNTATINITAQEDSTSAIIVNRGYTASFDSVVASLTEYGVCPTGGDFGLILPTTPIYQIYIRNLDPTNFVTLKYIPNGGVTQTLQKLYPGDIFLCWQNNQNASAGITQIWLNNVSGSNIAFESFFGA